MSSLLLMRETGERILLDGMVITVERLSASNAKDRSRVYLRFHAPGKRIFREEIAPADLVESCKSLMRGIADVRKAQNSGGASDQPGDGPAGDHGHRDVQLREGLGEG